MRNRRAPVRTAADATTASGKIVDAGGAGEITPSEGAEVGKILDTHVRNLRAKLAAAGAPVIETVHGVGYRCG